MYGEDIDLSYELQKTGKKNNTSVAELFTTKEKGPSGSLNGCQGLKSLCIFIKKQFMAQHGPTNSLFILEYTKSIAAVVARIAKSAFSLEILKFCFFSFKPN